MTTVAVKNQRKKTQSCIDTLKKLRMVMRAAQRHSAWIEKQCGVTAAQLWIIRELSDTPGLRVGELAARLAIHQTTTSNLLDALEKRNYVVKARDNADQRVVTVSLTAAGKEVLGCAPMPARGLLMYGLQKLDAKELSELDNGLRALLNAIGITNEVSGLQMLPFMM